MNLIVSACGQQANKNQKEIENINMTTVEAYNKLKKHFQEGGYVITYEDEADMSAQHPEKKFDFSQMVDGNYLESGLSWASNELLVQYDILDGTFSIEIFVKTPENERFAKLWMADLQKEVTRLELKEFIDLNYD